MDSKTRLFKMEVNDEVEIKEILDEVYNSLKERGYDPINQIVGYLISGDLGYISSYNNARSKIKLVDRSRLVEVLLNDFLDK